MLTKEKKKKKIFEMKLDTIIEEKEEEKKNFVDKLSKLSDQRDSEIEIMEERTKSLSKQLKKDSKQSQKPSTSNNSQHSQKKDVQTEKLSQPKKKDQGIDKILANKQPEIDSSILKKSPRIQQKKRF